MMQLRRKTNQHGDTIVEVLLATVILSVVLAGAYTLSNRATRLNQQAFERTQAALLVQAQQELVRAARDSWTQSSPGIWGNITRTPYRQTSAIFSDMTQCDGNTTLDGLSGVPRLNSYAFHIDRNNVLQDNLYEQDFFNVWVEMEEGGGGQYWNVHAFACWESIGGSPNNVTSSILRLENPI